MGRFEPSGDPGTLDAEVAAFDAELVRLGASTDDRSQLVDRFRAIAPLTGNERTLERLALAGDSLPILEDWLRGIGRDEAADEIGRMYVGLLVWLELPDDARALAGPPNP